VGVKRKTPSSKKETEENKPEVQGEKRVGGDERMGKGQVTGIGSQNERKRLSRNIGDPDLSNRRGRRRSVWTLPPFTGQVAIPAAMGG